MDELLYDGGWKLISDNPERGIRRYACVLMVDGKFQVIVKTENYAIGLILDANTRDRAETAGQKFGDFARVASVPIDIWNRELDEAHSAGDEAYVNKWLNDGDHAGFRTKEGML